jgi:hypothetical protein
MRQPIVNRIDDLKRNIRISDIIGKDITLRKEGNEFVALCPFHQEKSPSFKVSDTKGIFHCFGCNEHGDVVDWLRKYHGMTPIDAINILQPEAANSPIMHDEEILPDPIFPIPVGKTPSFPTIRQYRPESIFCYRNLDGAPIYYIARYPKTNEGKKTFIPAYYGTNKEFIYKAIQEPFLRPLYGLEYLSLPDPVIIVAGEKARDKLQEMIPEHPVSTWSGGESETAINKTDWSPLKNRRCIYWPDNDKQGLESVKYVAPHVGDLKQVIPPRPKPSKWDVADAIDEGWTKEDILNHIRDNQIKIAKPKSNNDPSAIAIELEHEEEALDIAEESFPRHLLETAPGLIGRITDWINKTAAYPIPEVALAAAIPAVGVLYGHRIQSETYARTNLYTLSLAASGIGKNHSRLCLMQLFKKAGLAYLIGGDPKSHVGIYKGLYDNKGRNFIMHDELGHYLAAANNKNSSSHLQRICSTYTMLYTSAQSFMPGEQGANTDNKNPRQDIDQPHQCLYGTTVAEKFYKALTSSEALDGFVARWLMFKAETKYQKPRVPEYNIYNPPQELINELITIENMPINVFTQGPFDTSKEINPRIIPFDDLARAMLNEFEDFILDKQNNGDHVSQPLWARAREIAIKLALCGHENGVISGKVLKWSIEVAKFCINQFIADIEAHIADTPYQATLKHILKVIREHKKITRAQLTAKTSQYDTRTRNDVLNTLTEAGYITSYQEKTSLKCKRPAEIIHYIPPSARQK